MLIFNDRFPTDDIIYIFQFIKLNLKLVTRRRRIAATFVRRPTESTVALRLL